MSTIDPVEGVDNPGLDVVSRKTEGVGRGSGAKGWSS